MNHPLVAMIFLIAAGCASGAETRAAGCKHPMELSAPNQFLQGVVRDTIEIATGKTQFGQILSSATFSRRNFSFSGCSLDQALDTFVAQDGNHRWTREGGVPNLIPLPGRIGMDLESEFDRRLPKFEVRGVDLQEAVHLLVTQLNAGGRPIFSANTMPRRITETPRSIVFPEFKVTLYAENLSVRQILNRLVAAYGDAHWQAAIIGNERISLSVSGHDGIGYRDVKLSDEAFARYLKISDRLAELRGLAVMRGLSEEEQAEQVRLRAEHAEFVKWRP